jgi:hypothetical protein
MPEQSPKRQVSKFLSKPIPRPYPAPAAAAWLGHSMMVARKHYWRVTNADFEHAAQGEAKPEAAAFRQEWRGVERNTRTRFRCGFRAASCETQLFVT